MLLKVYKVRGGTTKRTQRALRGLRGARDITLPIVGTALAPGKRPPVPEMRVGLFCGADGIREHDLRQTILVAGVGVADVRFRFLEFRLAELHNGA
jgi:hypothetical protein